MPEQLEKIGRFVLWVTLALVCMLTVLGLARYQNALAAASASLNALERHREEAKQQEADSKLRRLAFSSMGNVIKSFEPARALGEAWFTNVSARTGTVCVTGVAENAATKQALESLTACESVNPYAAVHLRFVFAPGTLSEMCKTAKCEMELRDEPDVAAHP
ncbi:MAG: hypothetical protein RL701_4359 [Pseudomonadota bacterium]|jgi:hypothetical protein